MRPAPEPPIPVESRAMPAPTRPPSEAGLSAGARRGRSDPVRRRGLPLRWASRHRPRAAAASTSGAARPIEGNAGPAVACQRYAVERHDEPLPAREDPAHVLQLEDHRPSTIPPCERPVMGRATLTNRRLSGPYVVPRWRVRSNPGLPPLVMVPDTRYAILGCWPRAESRLRARGALRRALRPGLGDQQRPGVRHAGNARGEGPGRTPARIRFRDRPPVARYRSPRRASGRSGMAFRPCRTPALTARRST